VDGNINLAVALGMVVLVAALVFPLAPFLPLLNRLPLVGSPRINVVFRLNGRRDLTLTVPSGQAHTCVLDVEVTNRERWTAVKDAWFNLLIPSGIKVGRCNQRGEVEDGGQWEDFHRHQLGSHPRADYWADTQWNLPPRFTQRIRVKLRLGHSGEDIDYPILLKLGAPSLYRLVEARATIKIREGEGSTADQMGHAITWGESSLEDVEGFAVMSNGDQQRRILMDFVALASPLLIDAVGNEPLPQTPEDQDATDPANRIRMHLTALYVVRNECGRAADDQSSETKSWYGKVSPSIIRKSVSRKRKALSRLLKRKAISSK
jgi:hypothetical protein